MEVNMAIVKNPITGEELKIVREDGYSKIVEDKHGNRYFVDFYGNVRSNQHDHFVVPLNDGIGKPSGHEFGDKKKKF